MARTDIVKRVEKLQSDRSYLRTVISTMVTVARDMPGTIKPAIVDQLKAALEKTKDEGEDV